MTILKSAKSQSASQGERITKYLGLFSGQNCLPNLVHWTSHIAGLNWQFEWIKSKTFVSGQVIRDPQPWLLLRGSKLVDLPFLTTGREERGKRDGSSVREARCIGRHGAHPHYEPASKQRHEHFHRVLGCAAACEHFYRAALHSKGGTGTGRALQTLPYGQPINSWPQRSTFRRVHHSKPWLREEVTRCHTQREAAALPHTPTNRWLYDAGFACCLWRFKK